MIINPRSRQGDTADIKMGLQKLQQAGITVETLTCGDAAQTEQDIAARVGTLDFVIVGGGDGTISATAQALYRHKLPFAILPLGTANDLARSLNIPTNLDKAFDVIIAANRRWIDLGLVNGHYFFNACHIGLGVKVTQELTPELKKRWGVLSYFKALSRALKRSREFSVDLVVDDVRHRRRALELTVGNGRYYGGGNLTDEHASIDDGLLNLSCIYPKTVWELLAMSPLIRLGKHDRAQRTYCVAGRRITVTTKVPMGVDADGEPATGTPATFEVINKALQVFAPPEADDASAQAEITDQRTSST